MAVLILTKEDMRLFESRFQPEIVIAQLSSRESELRLSNPKRLSSENFTETISPQNQQYRQVTIISLPYGIFR